MSGIDPLKAAQWDVIRARNSLVRCELCEQFHFLEDCLEFLEKSHNERREFLQGKGLCFICLQNHDYRMCPDRGMRVCGIRGCHSLTHHRVLHCEHQGYISAEMWEFTPEEEPACHINAAGHPVAGPSEVGLRKSMDDSGLTESESEEETGEESQVQEPSPRKLSLEEEAEKRKKHLQKCLDKLKTLEEEDNELIGVPTHRSPPRANEADCLLCMKAGKKLPRHNLANCPQFLVCSISVRETLAIKYACGVCLDVEHYVSTCPNSRRECGIYGCRLNHHPLLHRVQYLTPLYPGDDEICNWARHQQARQDGIEKAVRCAVCQRSHETRECAAWPRTGPQRIVQAIQDWICVKCLRFEHTYCPAAQVICGINRCVQHHDPFFHQERPHPLDFLRRNFGLDSWGDLQAAHLTRNAHEEETYRANQLSARRERIRTIEQLGEHMPMEHRYGGNGAGLVPYRVRRNGFGEICMTEDTFRQLAEGYEYAGNMARSLTIKAMRQMLLDLDEPVRQAILADDLAELRGDHIRLRIPFPEVGESEERYAFRTARRAVALELVPPPAPDRRPHYRPRDRTPTTSSGSGESTSEGTDETEPQPRRTNRLTLSGRPDEDEDPLGSSNPPDQEF